MTARACSSIVDCHYASLHGWHVANFPATPLSYLGCPSPTSFPNPLVSLFEACNCTFFTLLCLTTVVLFLSYKVIMPRNIFLHHSLPLCPHMGFFISPLVLTLLNRTVIYLKPLVLSYSIIRFLNVFGGCYLSCILFD